MTNEAIGPTYKHMFLSGLLFWGLNVVFCVWLMFGVSRLHGGRRPRVEAGVASRPEQRSATCMWLLISENDMEIILLSIIPLY